MLSSVFLPRAGALETAPQDSLCGSPAGGKLISRNGRDRAQDGPAAKCRCQRCLTPNANRSAFRLAALWLQTTRHRATHSALYRIKALFQHKTLMDTASPATSPRRRSTLLGIEAALLRAATEASAPACARSESAAPEAVTSWAGSARKPSLIRVSSLPGSPLAPQWPLNCRGLSVAGSP